MTGSRWCPGVMATETQETLGSSLGPPSCVSAAVPHVGWPTRGTAHYVTAPHGHDGPTEKERDGNAPDGDNESGLIPAERLAPQLRQDVRDAAEGKTGDRHYISYRRQGQDNSCQPERNQDEQG
jgi:hypothetical protein